MTDTPEDDEDLCPNCGDGDAVPDQGYWRCPVCDAEWNQDDEDDAPVDRNRSWPVLGPGAK